LRLNIIIARVASSLYRGTWSSFVLCVPNTYTTA